MLYARLMVFCTFSILVALTGTVNANSFKGPLSGIDIFYEIDLPEGYDNDTKKYQVIYMLHSWGRNHNNQFKCTLENKAKCDWNNGKPVKHLKAAIASGAIDPTILVYPNAKKSTFYADSFDGTKLIETNIIKELIPHIESQYRAKSGRKNRALMGLRLGGYGAVLYGTKYPEMFAATVSVTGSIHDWKTCLISDDKHPACRTDMFNNNYSYFLEFSPWHNAERNKAALVNQGSAFRIVLGDDDEMNGHAINFVKRLKQQGIVHEYEQVKTCTGDRKMARSFDCIMSNEKRDSFAFIGEHLRKAK